MTNILLWSLGLSLVINGILFLLAFYLKSDKLTDASYAATFIILALVNFAYSGRNLYDIIAVLLVVFWALRIGGFLLLRVIRTGKDRRFDGVRENFVKFGKFWLGQALTVWVLMIPVILILARNTNWHNFALAGIAVWLAGFVLESVADQQKYRFARSPIHQNQWIDTGLWRYARHPNYLGEILVWVGIYLYALPNLSLMGGLVGLVSPLFITVLLLFVSGVPILEKQADERWGNNPAYQSYKKQTRTLLPLPIKSRVD